MVAARDIDQGELIFSEEALVKGPNHTITTPHCLECLKVARKNVRGYFMFLFRRSWRKV